MASIVNQVKDLNQPSTINHQRKMSSTSNTNDIPPNSKELPPDTKNAVLFFWASWHEPTAPPNGSIHNLFHTLASSSSLSFYRIEAEVNPDLSMEYDVTVNLSSTMFSKILGQERQQIYLRDIKLLGVTQYLTSSTTCATRQDT